jgi:hypothetical protein
MNIWVFLCTARLLLFSANLDKSPAGANPRGSVVHTSFSRSAMCVSTVVVVIRRALPAVVVVPRALPAVVAIVPPIVAVSIVIPIVVHCSVLFPPALGCNARGLATFGCDALSLAAFGFAALLFIHALIVDGAVVTAPIVDTSVVHPIVHSTLSVHSVGRPLITPDDMTIPRHHSHCGATIGRARLATRRNAVDPNAAHTGRGPLSRGYSGVSAPLRSRRGSSAKGRECHKSNDLSHTRESSGEVVRAT